MRTTFIFLLLCYSVYINGQPLNDKVWIMGSTVAKVTFEQDTVTTQTTAHNVVYPLNSLASICDSDGNFLFYSNGMDIGNSNGDTMTGGTQLTDSIYYSIFYQVGNPNAQGVLILPKSGTEYYVFNHSVSDTGYNNHIPSPDRFRYSIVDMAEDSGRGTIISKRNLLYDKMFGDGRLTACRHANGRDWWVIHRGYSNNCYHKYLATPCGVEIKDIQCLGEGSYEVDWVGQAAFSPDGNHYASITENSTVVLVDFDRCSGTFSNPRWFSYPPIPPYMCDTTIAPTCTGGDGLCFSPSGRFLYVNSIYYLDQFDLWADTIENSRVTLGIYDSTYQSFGPFSHEYLCPDGHIYIDSYQGGTSKYSLITKPDEKAPACNFQKESFWVPTNNANSISNYPNMRLGKLTGSNCDTISSIDGINAESPFRVKIFPNPASTHLNIDILNYEDYNSINCFLLYTVSGELVAKVPLTYLSTSLDVSRLAGGQYYFELRTGTRIRISGKIAVHH